ncbi:Olfactory receptor 867 [Sciurus carolinensis]|uniref:Olfactory receptor 867 n=1 Tax=Sciurus carolinensis TaxID=30640 RepID=A0AA41MFC5_SCICA|nr:Olfactory receptor 867 [Sciurus carolinensis]
MEEENHTVLSQFLLLGLSEEPELQSILFGLFLSMYLVTLINEDVIESKYKAFSTCGSHICVISLYYGTRLLEYLSFTLTHSSQGFTVSSVMYTVVTPMLNHFIYSLRNMDVKGALGRLFSRAASSH